MLECPNNRPTAFVYGPMQSNLKKSGATLIACFLETFMTGLAEDESLNEEESCRT